MRWVSDSALVRSASTRAFGFARVLLGVNAGQRHRILRLDGLRAARALFEAQFFPHENAAAVMMSSFAVFAVGIASVLVGAIVRQVHQRHRRRSALLVSLSLMVAASFGIALLPPYASIGLLAPGASSSCALCRIRARSRARRAALPISLASAPDEDVACSPPPTRAASRWARLPSLGSSAFSRSFSTANSDGVVWLAPSCSPSRALSPWAASRCDAHCPRPIARLKEERRRRQPFSDLWR